MKSFLRLSMVFFLVPVLLASCVKVAVTPPVNTNPVVGSWVLTAASEGDSYGWTPFSTGLEGGIFTLLANGAAQYNDGSVSMQGNWYLTNVNRIYYDEYAGYYNGPHQQLQLQLSDYYTHSSINLNFDYVAFYGNSFSATYFNGQLVERYDFSRY